MSNMYNDNKYKLYYLIVKLAVSECHIQRNNAIAI